MSKNNLYLAFACCLFSIIGFSQSKKSNIIGHVLDQNQVPLYGATVIIKETNNGVITDNNGLFKFIGNYDGLYTIEVSFLGYKTLHKTITINRGNTKTVSFILEESNTQLSEIIITGKSKLQKVKEKAFNVTVVDAKKLHNTTLDIGHALGKVSGVRIRESGGVGSKMNFSLNGFRGNQVRFFIDGIPMDNMGSSFQLNNIPINLAERIEVYKGVVPVGLGSDALGGAVNIITNTYKKSHLDASYSYGSFNTHRSYVNAIYVSNKGFIAQMNAFQNYSDNNYEIKVDVADINTGKYYPNKTVKRFHDTYHNESVIFNLGFVNKSFADQLLFGITLGKNYKEIQTGARQASVFGAWNRRGNIIMPSIKYKKDDFILKNLDVKFNASYNLGAEKNIDTINRRYNWFGNYKEYNTPGGERSYSLYKYKNNNGLATANANYKINKHHNLALSSTLNTFNRKGVNELNPDSDIYQQPKKTLKNITGLGHDFKSSNWNTSLFIKQYFQKNTYAHAYNPTGGYGDVAYINKTNTFNFLGYGFAVTYFLHDNLQLKGSYEKTYRLPESNELFGDIINLEGNINLKPESSNNYNLGLSYWGNFNKIHQFSFSSNLFYRDAKDFIRPRLNKNQVMQVMDNLGSVTNLGIESEIRYTYNQNLSLGLNATYQDLRNNTKYDEGQTTVSVVYKDRIPNMPYLYGNGDINYAFLNLGNRKQELSIGYNLLYVHAFYLYWPSLGSDKLDISEQISHDLNFTYKFNKKVQFTLECRNITNSMLYDNFSLQKPGRSFSGKIRYVFF
ncbi:TonB-dependent receptor [Polaribacter sp. ALD11]|uniref:TonB-dependent receptor n=1 Tax=Polaribacter sp. ALD11 TaxID=2058137 RepID=UPI000C30A30E|nr:TonB-dependent receptor [Polaribacter sp. ALD11]AUC84605.1 TonB-dependent receptor [Polaribacter sp. ALD11]